MIERDPESLGEAVLTGATALIALAVVVAAIAAVAVAMRQDTGDAEGRPGHEGTSSDEEPGPPPGGGGETPPVPATEEGA